MRLPILGTILLLLAGVVNAAPTEDCSALDPRENISKETEMDITLSVEALSRISGAALKFKNRAKEEAKTLYNKYPNADQVLINSKMIYLYCVYLTTSGLSVRERLDAIKDLRNTLIPQNRSPLKSGETLSSVFLQAKANYDNGDYKDAEKKLRKIYKADQSYPGVLYLLGKALIRRDNFREANTFLGLVPATEEHEDLNFLRGISYYSSEDYKRAQASFTKAVNDFNIEMAHFWVANEYLIRSKFMVRKDLDAFQKEADSFVATANAHLSFARKVPSGTTIIMGNPTLFVDIHSSLFRLTAHLGKEYFNQGMYQPAIKYYLRAASFRNGPFGGIFPVSLKYYEAFIMELYVALYADTNRVLPSDANTRYKDAIETLTQIHNANKGVPKYQTVTDLTALALSIIDGRSTYTPKALSARLSFKYGFNGVELSAVHLKLPDGSEKNIGLDKTNTFEGEENIIATRGKKFVGRPLLVARVDGPTGSSESAFLPLIFPVP